MSWSVVTFDCYGTLVDWETGIAEAFRSEAERDDLELEPEAIIQAYHQVEPDVQATQYRPYRDILGEVALRLAARLGWELPASRTGFLAESLPDWPVFDDTRPALEPHQDTLRNRHPVQHRR